jgi:hypothetical protein
MVADWISRGMVNPNGGVVAPRWIGDQQERIAGNQIEQMGGAMAEDGAVNGGAKGCGVIHR